MLHPTFGPWQVAWWSHKETEPRLHGSLLIRSAHWLPCCRAAKENKTTIREAFVMDQKGLETSEPCSFRTPTLPMTS